MTIPRVLVATPVIGAPEHGTITTAYLNGMARIMTLALDPKIELCFAPATIFVDADLVRARSRAVRVALDGCFTHLLFWDSDIGGHCLEVLAGMLAQNVDVIGAAYPRKKLPLRFAHQAPFVPMGFTLLSQSCLEKMWDEYYNELHFDDVLGNKPFRTVAMFQLLLVEVDQPRPHRVLLGEDYSFCERWLRLGGEISVYDHPGTPLVHVGSFAYSVRPQDVLVAGGSSS